MKKRLEILVRLVDGGQLYWDTMTVVEDLTEEEIEALRPKSTLAPASPPRNQALSKATVQTLQNGVRAKLETAMAALRDRIVHKIR